MAREMEFKMERPNLVEVGQEYEVSENKVSRNYYYTLGHAYAMSGNYSVVDRLNPDKMTKGADGRLRGIGKVTNIRETEAGYYVTVEFEE